MLKIPQKVTPRDTHIAGFRLNLQPPRTTGVSKARPTQVVDPGTGYAAKALSDVSEALFNVADLFAKKEEVTRVANSQQLQMGISDTFRKIKEEHSKSVGEQTVGMLDEFRKREDKLRELSISKNLDHKTAKELTERFNKEYTKHAAWLVNHTIAQSEVADNEARIRSVQNAHENIANLMVGDAASIEQEINEVLKFEIARHPNLTENQIETNRRSLREDFITFAITKWVTDNPTAAVNFWDTNQKYLKHALPKMYPSMLKKIDVAREDAAYDIALGTLQRMFGNDVAGAAKFVDEDTAGVLKLTPTQRLSLSATLWGNHKYRTTQEELIRTKKEEEYLMNSIEKYHDTETGITNIQAALADLEQARRKNIIDSTTYRSTKNNLLSGEKFSTEESHLLLSMIDSQEVKTKSDILKFIYGKGVNPAQYFQALEKRQAQVDKGFTENWFEVAYNQFKELSKITKTSKLPSGLAEKELLVDITKLPEFKERLESEARQLGYAAGDPRIRKLAEDLMLGGWYTKARPEFHPGEAPWAFVGEKYLRKWEYDPEELYQKGEIEYLPEGETATGGTLGVEIMEMLKTPEGLEAYRELEKHGILPTKENIDKALIIIEKEKEE